MINILLTNKDEIYSSLIGKTFLMDNRSGVSKIFLTDKDCEDIIYDALMLNGIDIFKKEDGIEVKYKYINCHLKEIELSKIETLYLQLEGFFENYKSRFVLNTKKLNDNDFSFTFYKNYGESSLEILYESDIYFLKVENKKVNEFKNFDELKNFLLN